MKKYIFGILSILLVATRASTDIKATFQSLTFKKECSSFLELKITMGEFKAETEDEITNIQLTISMDILKDDANFAAKVQEKTQSEVTFDSNGQVTEPNKIATISGISGTYTKGETEGLNFVFDDLKERPSFCLSTFCLSGHQKSQTVNYLDEEPYFFIELTEINDGSTKPTVKVENTIIKNCLATAATIYCYPTEEEVPPEEKPTEKTVKIDLCGKETDTQIRLKFIKYNPSPVTGEYEKLEFDKTCVSDIKDLKLTMFNFKADVGDIQGITNFRLTAGVEGFSGSGVSEDIKDQTKASVEFSFKDAASTSVYGIKKINSIDGTYYIGEDAEYPFQFNTSLKAESFCYERFCLSQKQEKVQEIVYKGAEISQRNFTINLSNKGKETDKVVVRANGSKVEDCTVLDSAVTCQTQEAVMPPGEGTSKDYNITLELCDSEVDTGIIVKVSKTGSGFLAFSYLSFILVFFII